MLNASLSSPLIITQISDVFQHHGQLNSYDSQPTLVLLSICLGITLWRDKEKGRATEERLLVSSAVLIRRGWASMERSIRSIAHPRRPQSGGLEVNVTQIRRKKPFLFYMLVEYNQFSLRLSRAALWFVWVESAIPETLPGDPPETPLSLRGDQNSPVSMWFP